MAFISPSLGKVELQDLLDDMLFFIEQDLGSAYKIVIGTDSQRHKSHTQFVTAIVIHRVGRGARFYYRRRQSKGVYPIRQRIYMETQLSLELLEEMKELGFTERFASWPVEVHIDVGQEGETRKLIQEVVGWVSAVGYTAKIKPFSFGASTVADRLTKSHAPKSQAQ